MAKGGAVIRGEQFKIAFAPESTYGTDPGSSTSSTAYAYAFGVVESATLPDPRPEWYPVWTMTTTSNRNWYINYKQRMMLTGSIPDIILLNGYPLYLAIGKVTTTTGSPNTHTISEQMYLKSFSLHVTNVDSDGTTQLMRRWHGGKCGRSTISCAEGNFLRMSLDDIGFLNFTHNIQPSAVPDASGHYSNKVIDATAVSYPATQPYLFSYGKLTLGSTEFARVREFRIDINNNLEPRFYLTTGAEASLLAYEYREGRRQYGMTARIDISDNSLYSELVRLGEYSAAYTGFKVTLVFTRGTNDTITITSPSGDPATGGDALGCLFAAAPHSIVGNEPVVSVPVEIMMRSCSYTVADAVAVYPGE